MPVREFVNKLREAGYVPEDEKDLILSLSSDSSQTTIVMTRLREF
jgi:hypothetical protein